MKTLRGLMVEGLVESNLIRQTLNRIGYKNRILNVAKDTGYCRLALNDTVVFVDTGLEKKVSSDTKASLFAFELFYKKEKIISNLGQIDVSKCKEHEQFFSVIGRSFYIKYR